MINAICLCSHSRRQHHLADRATDRRGQCSEWGCKCGIFRDALVQSDTRQTVDAAANDQEGRR